MVDKCAVLLVVNFYVAGQCCNVGYDEFLIMSVLCLADTAVPNLHIILHPRGLQRNTEKEEWREERKQESKQGSKSLKH